MPKDESNFILSGEDKDPRASLNTRATPTLPAQIGGIVGAYLASVCIVSIAIYILARRLRNRLQETSENLSSEVRELHFVEGLDALGPSALMTDRMLAHTHTPEKGGRNPCIILPPSSFSNVDNKDQCFDSRVIEADREMSSRNLEEFYAHVMAQEEAKGNGISLASLPFPQPLQTIASTSTITPGSQKDIHEKKKTPCEAHKSSKSKILKKVAMSSSSLISRFKPSRVEAKPSHNLKISLPILQQSNEFGGGQMEKSGHLLSPRFLDSTSQQLSTSRDNQKQSSKQLTSGESTNHTYQSCTPSASLEMPLPSCSKSITYASNLGSTQSARSSLPLRKFELDSESQYLMPPTTKTTILDRIGQSDNLKIGSPGMTRSAGSTPYSPYQPLSMTIPVTPTLITREERKRRKKLKPKTPVLELVRSEADLWDSAYD